MAIEVKLAAVLASVENGKCIYSTFDPYDPANEVTVFRTHFPAVSAFSYLAVEKKYRPLTNAEVSRISDLCDDPHLGDVFAAEMDEVITFFISEKEWALVLKLEEANDAG